MNVLKDTKSILIVDNINMGFNNISSGIITSKNGENFLEGLKAFIKEINENLVVDYYGNTIDGIAFSKLISYLESDEKLYLEELRKKEEKEINFENIEEKFLNIILKLSIEEILFSSFYLGEGLTIWGNYNKRFVIFFKNKDELEKYRCIAERNNLIIEDIKLI